MTLTPGSVVKVWSTRYHFWHKGMVDWPDPLTAEQRVIHSEKGNFVRTTSLSEFAIAEMVHILWVPQTWEQQNSALQRMHSLRATRVGRCSGGGLNRRCLGCQRPRLRKKFRTRVEAKAGIKRLGLFDALLANRIE
jgi:hypothetical protein